MRGLSLAPAFDAVLSEGLAGDALHEVTPASSGDRTAAFGFALGVAAGFLQRSRAVGLIAAEDFACREFGVAYGPGLAAFGLDLDRLVFVRAPDAFALFSAMEEALRSGALAVVVGEAWSLRGYDLAISRRLLLAARKGGTPALLVQSGAAGAAEKLSTAAETRFAIAAAPSPHRASLGGARPLPGPPAFDVRLVKARLRLGPGPPAPVDRDRIVRLVWRSEDGRFDEPSLSLPVAAASVDGSRQAFKRD